MDAGHGHDGQAALRGPATSRTLEDVVCIVAAAYPADVTVLAACNTQLAHDAAFIRLLMRHNPCRVGAAISAFAPATRVGALLGMLSPERIVELRFEHQSLLNLTVDLARLDVIELLLRIPGIESLYEQSLFARLVRRGRSGAACGSAFACAEALSALTACSPATITDESSNLTLAAQAGLVDVVRRWLRDERCTAELLARQDGQSHTPFTAVCATICKLRSKGDCDTGAESPLARLVRCAQLLAWDSRNSPATNGADGANQLAWAAKAGLPDVLRPWVRDSRTTQEVLEQRMGDNYSHESLFHFCALATGSYEPFAVAHAPAIGIAHTSTCLDILFTHEKCTPTFRVSDEHLSNFHHACGAGAVNAVRVWLKHPDMTDELVTKNVSQYNGPNAKTAWTIAASRLDYEHAESHAHVQAVAVLGLLASSGRVHPCGIVFNYEEDCDARTYLCDVAAAVWLKGETLDKNSTTTKDFKPATIEAARQCLTLLGLDSRCQGLWTQIKHSDTCNAVYMCALGLEAVVSRLAKGNGWSLQGAHAYTHNPCDQSPFEELCKGLTWAQKLANKGGHDYPGSYLACVTSIVPAVQRITPSHRVTRMFNVLKNGVPHGAVTESWSCLAAACHAGLTSVVTSWLSTLGESGAALKPARRDACPPNDTPTSAFGLACARAVDSDLTPQQRQAGAECARLLFSTGKLEPGDFVGTSASNFDVAAQAGLEDICQAWLDKAEAPKLRKLAMDQIKDIAGKRWGR